VASEQRSLRRVLLAWARGDLQQRRASPVIREVGELGHAADLLAAGLSRRAARLEEQSAHLATLVESVSDGLLRIGPRGLVEFVNPAARAMLGWPPGAVGQPSSALVRSLELRQLIERVLQGQHVAGTEVAMGERRVLVSAQALPATDGTGGAAAGGAVIALSDLTALRRLEGVRRDFVANVSHELKTPLTSIRGYTDTLLAESPPPELQHQFLQVIQRNADRLQRIVDELLDLAMIESGAWQPQLEEIRAAELVQDVWNSCRDSADQRDISFSPPDSDVRVLADPGALRQVIGNLFDNAIRYTREGGHIRVRITRTSAASPDHASLARPGPAAAKTDRVAIEVSDNGAGIPHDALSRIFERFYRVDPARSRAAGSTGVGRAIVKHMVEGMGGTVEAESELGKGTTMRCLLPPA